MKYCYVLLESPKFADCDDVGYLRLTGDIMHDYSSKQQNISHEYI